MEPSRINPQAAILRILEVQLFPTLPIIDPNQETINEPFFGGVLIRHVNQQMGWSSQSWKSK